MCTTPLPLSQAAALICKARSESNEHSSHFHVQDTGRHDTAVSVSWCPTAVIQHIHVRSARIKTRVDNRLFADADLRVSRCQFCQASVGDMFI